MLEPDFKERLARVVEACGALVVSRVARVDRRFLKPGITMQRNTRVALVGAVEWLEGQLAIDADRARIRRAAVEREARRKVNTVSANDELNVPALELRLQPAVLATSQREWRERTGLPLSVRSSLVAFRGDVGPDKIRHVATLFGVC